MHQIPKENINLAVAYSKQYSVEEYLLLCDKFGAWFEMTNGQISWRFNGEILPESMIENLLSGREDQILQADNHYTMATSGHGKIIMNISACLYNALKDKPYFVYSQAPNIYIALTGSHRVPDAAVIPEKELFNLKGETLNPIILVEVVSPSSLHLDKVVKLKEYCSIETLQEYLIVSQENVFIEHFIKEKTNEWLYCTYDKREENIFLPSVSIAMSVQNLYQNTEL
jgi:Uma2 family endonuclease